MWKTLSEKVVHENKWYKINKKKFEMPNKKKGCYFVLETSGASMIIPIIDNQIIFVKQYRYTINKWSIELPSGTIKNNSSNLTCAKEELLEETGFLAGSIKKIGKIATETGIMSEICYVYLAYDLKFSGCIFEETEDIKVLKIKIRDVYKMIDSGKIIHSLTLASLMIAKNKLLKIKA